MPGTPKPPKTYEEFIQRYPKIARAWEQLAEAGKDGPLDAKAARLVKLALAIGTKSEGAVHANVRKALALGITAAEIEQVVALAAPKIGLPATVAIYSWVQDMLTDAEKAQ